MQKLHRKKTGFTLAEVLIGLIVFALGVIGVIVAANNAMSYVQDMRWRIVSLNLAREGMEQVYQIRDTNRRRRSGKKDQCRLVADPFAASDGCETQERIQKGTYYVQEKNTGNQKYFSLTAQATGDFYGDTPPQNYAVTNSGGVRGIATTSDINNKEGTFFRVIEVEGLFSKSGGPDATLNCGNGNSPVCGGPEAKELRFCSTVYYVGGRTGEVQLCGVMTNFLGLSE